MRPSLVVTALLAVAVLVPAAPAAAQAPAVCPATFEVLHDDTIGKLRLPAGPYEITTRGGISCAAAAERFREFLEDFDGVLPRPWRLNVAAASFTRGSSAVGFSVARTQSPHGGGGGGRHPATGTRCPGTFQVLHNDRIGQLRLKAGLYRITLLSTGKLTCSRAATLFARFLQDFDGVLPRPWALNVATGTFRRGAGHVGFRVKPFSGTPSGGGGSGVHPRNARVCPTFRVLHDDRIGKLALPRGKYSVTLLKGGGLTCPSASMWFTDFLDNDYTGRLPRPWKLNAQTGTFTRGSAANGGFRVKLLRG
jgi:hypothetical protein